MKGMANPVADALSRSSVNQFHATQPPVLDMECMAKAQAEDPELSHTSVFRLVLPPVCDSNTGTPCPFVPAAWYSTHCIPLHTQVFEAHRRAFRLE